MYPIQWTMKYVVQRDWSLPNTTPRYWFSGYVYKERYAEDEHFLTTIISVVNTNLSYPLWKQQCTCHVMRHVKCKRELKYHLVNLMIKEDSEQFISNKEIPRIRKPRKQNAWNIPFKVVFLVALSWLASKRESFPPWSLSKSYKRSSVWKN